MPGQMPGQMPGAMPQMPMMNNMGMQQMPMQYPPMNPMQQMQAGCVSLVCSRQGMQMPETPMQMQQGGNPMFNMPGSNPGMPNMPPGSQGMMSPRQLQQMQAMQQMQAPPWFTV